MKRAVHRYSGRRLASCLWLPVLLVALAAMGSLPGCERDGDATERPSTTMGDTDITKTSVPQPPESTTMSLVMPTDLGGPQLAPELEEVKAELLCSLGDLDVPIYLPTELPTGLAFGVPDVFPGIPANPNYWRSLDRHDPHGSGYSVFFVGKGGWIRLNVNPPGDHGDVIWVESSVEWAGLPLKTTEAGEMVWISIPVPEDARVEIETQRPLLEEALLLASGLQLAEGN